MLQWVAPSPALCCAGSTVPLIPRSWANRGQHPTRRHLSVVPKHAIVRDAWSFLETVFVIRVVVIGTSIIHTKTCPRQGAPVGGRSALDKFSSVFGIFVPKS